MTMTVSAPGAVAVERMDAVAGVDWREGRVE